MKKKYFLDELLTLDFNLQKPSIVFLYGDLAAGKTTLSRYILEKYAWVTDDIYSPTYTYYNSYWENHHFDLYRLKNYDEFFAIWAEDILDNNTGIILVEWPELIADYYKADIEIYLSKTSDLNQREIEIIYNTKK